MYAVLIFAVALSMDGFGMGISYGLRRIKIPCIPLLIICLSSAIALIISMAFGRIIAIFMPYKIAVILGAVILIAVGISIILQNYLLNLQACQICCLRFTNLGIVIKILKEPVLADFNNSGNINIKEAIFLGLALAMDTLGAGFGAAMSGYSLIWTPIILAITKYILINVGIFIGRKIPVFGTNNKITAMIPGGIIIILGLSKLFSL